MLYRFVTDTRAVNRFIGFIHGFMASFFFLNIIYLLCFVCKCMMKRACGEFHFIQTSRPWIKPGKDTSVFLSGELNLVL